MAWKADQRTVAAIAAPAGTTVQLYRTDTPLRREQEDRPIVMQNFEPVAALDYSNVLHHPSWFFEWYGFDVVDTGTAMPRPPTHRSDLAEWRSEPREGRVSVAPYHRKD